jgi:hypothetical protein
MRNLENKLRGVDFSKSTDLKDRLRGVLYEKGMDTAPMRLTEEDLFLVNAAGEAFVTGTDKKE